MALESASVQSPQPAPASEMKDFLSPSIKGARIAAIGLIPSAVPHGSLVVPHLNPQILRQFQRFVEPVIQNAELHLVVHLVHFLPVDLTVPNAKKLQFTSAVQFLCNSTLRHCQIAAAIAG